MNSDPLCMEVTGKVVDFEAVCRWAVADGRYTEDEARKIVAAGHALGCDAAVLAETVDLIGALARSTQGVNGSRVTERMWRILARLGRLGGLARIVARAA